MIAPSVAPTLLGSWWDETREALAPLNLQPAPLDPSLAEATGSGRISLRAERWLLGKAGTVAECRIVRIKGASSEIVNTLVFPRRPEALPMFVADAMVIGGHLRMAFIDLPTPGLDEIRARHVAMVTRRLQTEFPGRLEATEAPPWAVEFSGGGCLFLRSGPPEQGAQLGDARRAYLKLWVELARQADGSPAGPVGTSGLSCFKQGHLAHWPGTAYLSKLFGPEWTRRFLNDFLYR